jgi:hypothetical protein
MRPLKEIKSDLEKAQSEYEEARKQYKALTAPGDKVKRVQMTEVRPAHNRMTNARDLILELEKELEEAEE